MRLQVSFIDIPRAYFHARTSEEQPIYVDLPPEDPFNFMSRAPKKQATKPRDLDNPDAERRIAAKMKNTGFMS